MPESRQIDDPRTLKALAHPLRIQLLDALREHGPATATALAERLGESSGSTSYHLRQLAQHGFVEDDPGRSKGRERWWRIVEQSITVQGFELMSRAETRADATTFLHELKRAREARVHRWLAEGASWDKAWQDATLDTEVRLSLTREELAELSEELMALLGRYVEHVQGRRTPDGAAVIDVQAMAFPLRMASSD